MEQLAASASGSFCPQDLVFLKYDRFHEVVLRWFIHHYNQHCAISQI